MCVLIHSPRYSAHSLHVLIHSSPLHLLRYSVLVMHVLIQAIHRRSIRFNIRFIRFIQLCIITFSTKCMFRSSLSSCFILSIQTNINQSPRIPTCLFSLFHPLINSIPSINPLPSKHLKRGNSVYVQNCRKRCQATSIHSRCVQWCLFHKN